MSTSESGEMARYDITNDEQLRILTDRLDEMSGERHTSDERIDRMAAESADTNAEWQAWRKRIEERLSGHAALIAKRLAHPLMDPETVNEMRRAQTAIGAHLTTQDATLDLLRGELDRRFVPVERITDRLDQVIKMLRWVLLAFGGGGFYEVGRVLIDRWLR